MALFLQILGSNLFILWAMGKVLGNELLDILGSPYAELYLEYNWLLLTTAISMVIFSQVLKHNKRKASRTSHRVRERDDSSPRTHSIQPQGKRNKALSMQIEWTPLNSGGASFKASNLHKISDSRIEIKSSSGMKLFSALFIAIGVGIPSVMGVIEYQDTGFGWELLFPAIVGLIFTGVGVLMMFLPRTRYFDKRLGWFWVGKKSPSGEQAFRQLSIASPLKELVALQIIAEQITGKNGGYTSWEINIIHKDNTRYNVIDHGDKTSIDYDAKIISEFLSIPILANEQSVE